MFGEELRGYWIVGEAEVSYVVGIMIFCYGWKRQNTVEVTGLREGGDVRGCLLTAIMILDYWVQKHTYLRCA